MNKLVKAMTGFLASAILVGGMSLGSLSAATADPNEPNNSMKKATSVTLGKSYNGEIGNYYTWKKNGLDEDWFKFKGTAGRAYKITMKGYKDHFADTTLLVDTGNSDDFKNSKYGSVNIRTDLKDDDTATIVCEKSGTIYIKIWNFFDYSSDKNGPTGQKTNYTLSVKEGPVPLRLIYDNNSYTAVCGSQLQLVSAKGAKSWTSSNKSIATVTDSGLVTAKQAGPVIITGKTSSGKQILVLEVLYKDVTNTKNFWYDPTYYLTNKNVVKGYDKQTKFKPGNDCTRAQMVTFLWRLNGSPAPKSTSCKFNDVKKGAYYYKAVLWAVEKGITTGVSKTKFKPSGVCTRAQTVTFLWRMAGKPSIGNAKNPFKDVKKTDYFYDAVIWASNNKIVAGYKDKTFKPSGKCLRRQMVTFLYKYDKNIKK